MSEREIKMIIRFMREEATLVEGVAFEDEFERGRSAGWDDAADFLEKLLLNDATAWDGVYEAR